MESTLKLINWLYNTHEIHEIVRRALLYLSDDVVIKTVSGKMCSRIPIKGRESTFYKNEILWQMARASRRSSLR